MDTGRLRPVSGERKGGGCAAAGRKGNTWTLRGRRRTPSARPQRRFPKSQMEWLRERHGTKFCAAPRPHSSYHASVRLNPPIRRRENTNPSDVAASGNTIGDIGGFRYGSRFTFAIANAITQSSWYPLGAL